MNSRERVLKALKLGQPDQVPFIDDVDQSVKERIMGKKNFTEQAFARALGMDAIAVNSCSAPVFCKTRVLNGRRWFLDGIIKNEHDLKKAVFPNPTDDSFYDPVKRFIDVNKDSDLALYAECRWGTSGVLYSMGLEGLSYALYDNPRLIENLLDRYVAWNCIVMETLNRIGLDFIVTYGNIACNTGLLISPTVFRELFIPKIKLVANACKLPWIYHGDGNISPIIDDLLALGMSGIHPIEPVSMDLAEIKNKYGDKLCLWGNVDLRYTLTRGTPDDVEREVINCIKKAGNHGGYIIGSANSLTDYCPTENILAMAKAIKKHGNYPLSV